MVGTRRIYIVSEFHGEEFGLDTKHLDGPFDRATPAQSGSIEALVSKFGEEYGEILQGTNIVTADCEKSFFALVWVKIHKAPEAGNV